MEGKNKDACYNSFLAKTYPGRISTDSETVFPPGAVNTEPLQPLSEEEYGVLLKILTIFITNL